MRYHVLAADYDGTLAHHGKVDPATIKQLSKLKESGRRLVLVTGRRLEPLLNVFPVISVFDLAVVENGALLYEPERGIETPLADAPPPEFAATLRERGVTRLGEGRVIVAGWEPDDQTMHDVIRDLGLELQIIFNKDAVMVLPTGINKATGLT